MPFPLPAYLPLFIAVVLSEPPGGLSVLFFYFKKNSFMPFPLPAYLPLFIAMVLSEPPGGLSVLFYYF